MRRYNLVLQGGVNIVIDEREKLHILKCEENALKNDQKDFFIDLGKNKFKKSMIKGIFEVREETPDNKEEWISSRKAWNDECLAMAKLPLEEKVAKEMNVRILPGLKLGKISLTDVELAVMESHIRQFFLDNPKYPRCPMKVWFPFVSDKGGKENYYFGKWWMIVARNDGAIAEWAKFNL